MCVCVCVRTSHAYPQCVLSMCEWAGSACKISQSRAQQSRMPPLHVTVVYSPVFFSSFQSTHLLSPTRHAHPQYQSRRARHYRFEVSPHSPADTGRHSGALFIPRPLVLMCCAALCSAWPEIQSRKVCLGKVLRRPGSNAIVRRAAARNSLSRRGTQEGMRWHRVNELIRIEGRFVLLFCVLTNVRARRYPCRYGALLSCGRLR